MTTRFAWLGTLALAILNVLTAQAQQPLPQPAPGPMPPGSHSGIEAAADLVRASHHLEALDAPELAAQVRQQARAVLEREAQRLAHEQAAIQQLAQNLPQAQPQYMIQAIVARAGVTQDGLEEIVQEVAGASVVHHQEGESVWTLSSNCCSEVLRALAGDHESRVQILSRPQIVTLNGQPASVMVGSPVAPIAGVEEQNGTVAPIVQADHCGISVILTPQGAAERLIRVEAVLEESTFQGSVPVYANPQTGETIQSPVKYITTARSIVEVPSGGMLIMAVPCETAADCAAEQGTTSMLLLFAAPQMVAR